MLPDWTWVHSSVIINNMYSYFFMLVDQCMTKWIKEAKVDG